MKKYRTNNSFYNNSALIDIDQNKFETFDSMIYTAEEDDEYCSGCYDYEQYMDDKKMDIDYESMKSMYPDTCKRISKYVEEECNRIDYEGSALYDEVMDKELIEIIVDRIYDRLSEEEMKAEAIEEVIDDLEEPIVGLDYDEMPIKKQMVKVMLLNDMYGRRWRRCNRRRNRRCRPMPYPYNYRRCYPRPCPRPYPRPYPNPYQYPYDRGRYNR